MTTPMASSVVGGLVLALYVWATPVWAQQASSIAGTVRDASGAVLPGVTVEAASPALIQKVRVVVSEGEGRYSIVDLRPGGYVVTFTLPGFNTFRRDGISLTAGFTATVNGEMSVGGLEETIIVSGAAPLVDTQNVRQQQVVGAELLAALPSGTQSLSNLITLTAGMTGTTDIGGSSGLYRGNAPRVNTYHGKAGAGVLYDGMNTIAGISGMSYVLNPATAEETVVETGGVSAESSVSGIQMNMVPKTGSNTFAFMASGMFTGEDLQSDDLSDDLRAVGVTEASKVYHIYDANVTAGGPLKRDRLWFFVASRTAGNKNAVVGVFFNKTQDTRSTRRTWTGPASEGNGSRASAAG